MQAPDAEQIVYVIDDDEAVRDAIGFLLEAVGLAFRSYGSAQAFLDDYDRSGGGCLVLDIRMPGMSGLELQQRLAQQRATLPIIFITGHGDIPMAVEAMRRGALDFIRKPFRDQELIDRIHEALDSDAEQRAERAVAGDVVEHLASLTPRERQVFTRVTDGDANKVIAIDLGISERTVEIHRAQAMKKMKARSLAQLVRMRLIADRGRDPYGD